MLALTVFALVLCYLVARPFITSLAWAMALTVVGWPLHRRLAQRIRWPTAAATCSVIIVAVLLIVPAVILVPAVADEAIDGFKVFRAQIESDAWGGVLERNTWIKPGWDWIRQRVDLGDVVRHAGALLTAAASFAVRASFVGTLELAFVFFFLFYFLRDRDAILAGIRALLPLSTAEMDRLVHVAGDTTFATVFGKVLVGVVQGLLGGLMFWWLDISAAWFWAIVMGLLSVVPLLGPPLVWVPAAIVLLLEGAWGQAIILLAWGAAVVGLADNLLYPMVVGRHLRLHTVPMLIAMIGGVIVFGAAGFFLGPVVLVVTITVLEIWRERAAAAAIARSAPM